MKMTFPFRVRRYNLLGAVALSLALAIGLVWWRFDADLKSAYLRAGRNSVVIATHCGPIEYQEAGAGTALLAIHGSGGGHDQGMAFAAPLAKHGIRVIAMSRFGYLRTPVPADASPSAQADAHVCLLDALGIRRVAVLGGSAGAPSALQFAIRHPERVAALILLVPLAYKPPTRAASARAMPPWVETAMISVIASDFLFWSALQIFRDPLIGTVLATPPELLASAGPVEQAQIDAMLDNILPVSARATGLLSDTAIGKHLTPTTLSSIRAPTLIISARDDRYGTFASAQYTASQIAGARFIGFTRGGHTWVGHDSDVMAAILKLLTPAGVASGQ